MESRPIGQEAAFKGPGQGGACKAPTGPAGWSWSRPLSRRSPHARTHPLQPPLGASGARFAGTGWDLVAG